MKRQFLLLLAFISGFGFHVQAQKPNRIAYIDMEYILANVPEYQEASAQLDKKVQAWRDEMEKEKKKVENMKISLEQERPLLTKELIEEREANITFEESKLAEYQQQRFGPNGDFVNQKKQLIKPVQDQVFNAIQEIGAQRNYDFIFDRTSNVGMVFSAEKHDISDQVLRTIQRASKREQLSSKEDIAVMEKEEGRSVEEDKAIEKKEKAAEAVKNEREALIAERQQKRDSINDARKKAFEERRAKILQERQRKKDSIEKIRNKKETDSTTTRTNN